MLDNALREREIERERGRESETEEEDSGIQPIKKFNTKPFG